MSTVGGGSVFTAECSRPRTSGPESNRWQTREAETRESQIAARGLALLATNHIASMPDRGARALYHALGRGRANRRHLVSDPASTSGQATAGSEAGLQAGISEVSTHQLAREQNNVLRSETAWGLYAHEEPRRTCLWLIDSPSFDLVVLIVIIGNCILMALDVPSGVSPLLGVIIARANVFFLGFYTVELLVRVVAVGLHCRPGGFFSDPFAVFEGLIVFVSWIVLLIPTGEATLVRSVTRSFRSLRVLFVLNDIPGMPQLVRASLNAIPSVWNVSGLCFGVLCMMGVTGVQFFRGVYHFRCANADIKAYAHLHHLPFRVGGKLQEREASASHDFSWQQRFDTTGIFCFHRPDSCPHGSVCYEFEQNPDGMSSFDSVIAGTLPLLQTFLLDAWAEEMFNMMAAYGWIAALYFVTLASFGGFLVLQLFLAVISDTFVAIEHQRREEEADEAPDENEDVLYQPSAEGIQPSARHIAGEPRPGIEFTNDLIEPPRPLSMILALLRHIEVFVTAPYFVLFVNLLVVVNVVLMAMPFARQPTERTRLLESASTVLSSLFVAEFGLKLLGLGCKRYWQSAWNAIDGSLAILSVGEFVLQSFANDHPLTSLKLTSTLRLLRMIRVLRALRMVRAWPSMYRNVVAFVRAIPQVTNLLILLCCVVFIFAIVGMQVFGLTTPSADSHAHFESFVPAALTIFESFAVGFVDVSRACYSAAGLVPTVLYFVPVLVIGYLGIMNLFVAILLETFQETRDQEALTDAQLPPAAQALAEVRTTLMARTPSAPLEFTTPPHCDHPGVVPAQVTMHHTKGSTLRDTAAAIASNDKFEVLITFLIVFSSVCLVLDNPRRDPRYVCARFELGSSEYDDCQDTSLKQYLDVANVWFTLIFTLEALLKVYAYGNSYFGVSWNVVDFAIVCSSLLSLLTNFSMFRSLRVMRVLRPLRLLSRNPNMKVVIETLVRTLPAVVNVLAFVLGLMAIFAIVGMQLFMGTFASCTDPALTTRAQCLSHLSPTPPPLPLQLASPHEFVSSAAPAIFATSSPPLDHHRELRGMGFMFSRAREERTIVDGGPEWVNPNVGNFDSFGDGMLALFIAMTGDNMPRLMWLGMDAEDVDVAPVRKDWSASAIYFLAWQVIGTFMALNLFVGAIVDSFSTMRRETDGMAFMTPAQEHWVDLLREVRRITPVRVVRPPAADSWVGLHVRMPLYKLARSRRFEFVMYFVICANILLLCWDYYRIEENALHICVYETLTFTFRTIYLLEFLIKVAGLGMQGYFWSKTRTFEFVLLAATGIEQLITSYESLVSYFDMPPMTLRLLRIVRILRILRLIGDRHLGRTRELLHTLMLSVPALLNVASVLILVMSIYAVLGMQLFPFVKHGERLNEYANFESFGGAMLLLFQVLTGDEWSIILHDATVDPNHGCDPDAEPTDCGSDLAIPYFVSFVVVGAFIFLNLVVAVVLESFGNLRGWKEESELAELSGRAGLITSDHLVEYRELWADYSADYKDDEGDSAIHCEDLPSLVAQLSYPLGLQRTVDGQRHSTINFVGAQRLDAASRIIRKPRTSVISEPVDNHGRAVGWSGALAEAQDERECEAINFCLQIKGLRGEVSNASLLDFHDTISALVRHSFERSRIESPIACMPPERQHAGCDTFRELSRLDVETPRLLWFRERLMRAFGHPATKTPAMAQVEPTTTATIEKAAVAPSFSEGPLVTQNSTRAGELSQSSLHLPAAIPLPLGVQVQRPMLLADGVARRDVASSIRDDDWHQMERDATSVKAAASAPTGSENDLAC